MDYDLISGPKATEGSLRNWINYDPIPVDQILRDAESLIYARLRVREMRASVPIAITAGNVSSPLPARFLDPIALHDSKAGIYLTLRDERELLGLIARDAAGAVISQEASNYAIYNEALNYDAAWPDARSLTLMFYQAAAPLSASNKTNFLTTRYPRMLRSALLAFAADYRQDDANYTRWMTQAVGMMEGANVEADLSRRTSDITG